MLIDDDEDDREIFISVIESIAPAISCSIAINGKDALDTLGALNFLPDMIFLDLNMPLMDGKQFLKEIKQRTMLKDIPIVVLSTSSDKETVHLIRTLGAQDFITKPDKYSDWEEVLKKLI